MNHIWIRLEKKAIEITPTCAICLAHKSNIHKAARDNSYKRNGFETGRRGRKVGRKEISNMKEMSAHNRVIKRKPLNEETTERSNENLSIKPTSYQNKHEGIFPLSAWNPNSQ